MRRTTVLDAAARALRGALFASRSLPNAAYYRLAGANYRYRAVATEKRVRDESFRSYELYNRHGNDWLLAALLDRCRDGECVVDVGANTGVYSLSVAAEYPAATVVAIEPNPEIAKTLRANVAASDFEDRIRSLEVGLGAENGSLPFYRSSYHELSSFNRFNAERWGARVVSVEDVPIRTLDSFVEGGEVPPPDHLKIDVEGFGLDVLRGARDVLATHRPFVYVEPHARSEGEPDDRGEAAAGIRDLLAEEGYAIIPGEDGRVCVPESP
ncbi:FkbM family methyltransferase [Halalkalicoccus sp. NIPERK01]|uniref:FkbM family methyltransferase n=1 Tax=Halalkalicoccus sp. NIPERK01 TaxID=3053469 RepID=UPI00256EBE71|nr:FkbM family methyltransferase [Halalkalicoccus sp. NIPERK01]MDL5363937.1 FkbM family methyltransferase [Halalkalicoccus sp. NIPERK01]